MYLAFPLLKQTLTENAQYIHVCINVTGVKQHQLLQYPNRII